MANFKTHMVVGAIASSGLAAVAVSLDGIEMRHAVAFGLAGTLGGILPDIDSDNSFAINLVFTVFAVFMSVLFIYSYYDALPLHYLFGMGASAFIVVRYVFRFIFEKLTIHRGVFHSLLAAVMMTVAATTLGHYGLALNELNAWLFGIFVGFGYVVHLLLDEIYSVDLSNIRIKRSFGTALKPLSLDYPLATITTLAITIGLFWISPETKPFTDVVFNSQTFDQIVKLFVSS